MNYTAQRGALNALLIPLILVIVLCIGAAGFGYWAYAGRQDYKNNVDQKVADAVSVAKQQVSAQKDKEFAEKEKFPYRKYDGPAAYGNIEIQYPKTWSAYVEEQDQSSQPVDGYFAPVFVPKINNVNSTFALRVQVVQQTYDSVLQQFTSFVTQKKASVHPYQSPNVPNTVGARVDGQISSTKQGSMVVLPMRDKTLKIWTENDTFKSDFDNIVLPNFSFTP